MDHQRNCINNTHSSATMEPEHLTNATTTKCIRVVVLGILIAATTSCVSTQSKAFSDSDISNVLGRHGLILQGVQRDGSYTAVGHANNYSDAIDMAQTKLKEKGYTEDKTTKPIIETPANTETKEWAVIIKGRKICAGTSNPTIYSDGSISDEQMQAELKQRRQDRIAEEAMRQLREGKKIKNKNKPGQLDITAINKLWKKSLPRVNRYYRLAIRRTPNLHGKIIIKISAKDGIITNITFPPDDGKGSKKTLHNAYLEGSIRTIIESWPLPESTGDKEIYLKLIYPKINLNH